MHNSPGVCLWFTGPSGAGKTTVATQLEAALRAKGREVTVLDVVPALAKHWGERTSEGKLLRKAFVAREVVRHGGIVICVTASGRADARERAFRVVGEDDSVEVFFDAPSQTTAERRATRSKKTPLLKRGRRALRRIRRTWRGGETYQRPTAPDLRVRSVESPPEEVAAEVVRLLVDLGRVEPDLGGSEAAIAYANDPAGRGRTRVSPLSSARPQR